VVDNNTTTLIVIDGATNSISYAPIGSAPYGVTVNPDTGKVYVSNTNDGTVSVLQW
jgi:DNA-binding beta-propeller fold protein YncE